MSTGNYKLKVIVTSCSLALFSMGALAAGTSSTYSSGQTSATQMNSNNAGNSAMRTSSDEAKDAVEHINKAAAVLHQMESNPKVKATLARAQGVLVVPDYGRAALGVGASGGAGVLLIRNGSTWSHPAFYNIGGISAGAQAGVEAGAIAFILNDSKAINEFKQDNNFALNADAGLTIVNWSGKAQGSVGKGDVIVWSDTEGVFGSLAVSVTDINFDEAETGAYYRQNATAKDVVNGKIKNPQSAALKQALKGSGV